jgi:hypothetical protein
MPSSSNTSGEHQIYEVQQWERPHIDGEQYFFVYWEHGRTGFKYVFPNIAARDELEAYTIALKKLDTGDH